MSNLLAQLVLARRAPDDGWMNILVIVVMAVIWIIGGIVKAMKANSADKQQPSRAPSREPPAHGRAGQQQMPGRPERPVGPVQRSVQPSGVKKNRTTLGDLREAARKFAAEAEQAFQPQTRRPAPSKPKLAPKRSLGPNVAPAKALPIEPVVPLRRQVHDKQAPATEAAPIQYLSDLLSDYRDPMKLRRAILHYEILGPPLSLRD